MTIGTLERYKGHLLNWYDIETLTPLEPRYVSMVDSGNLLASLWALEHGLNEMMGEPILDARPLPACGTPPRSYTNRHTGRRYRLRYPRPR